MYRNHELVIFFPVSSNVFIIFHNFPIIYSLLQICVRTVKLKSFIENIYFSRKRLTRLMLYKLIQLFIVSLSKTLEIKGFLCSISGHNLSLNQI